MNRDPIYGAFLIIIATLSIISILLPSTGLFTDIAKENPAPVLEKPARPEKPEKTDPVEVGLFPVDLNAATTAQLMLLPGVGEKTAAKIVEKRQELGGFKSVDDLTEVKGIGKVKLERIRPMVSIKTSKGQGR